MRPLSLDHLLSFSEPARPAASLMPVASSSPPILPAVSASSPSRFLRSGTQITGYTEQSHYTEPTCTKEKPTKPLPLRGADASYKYSQCSLTLPLRHLSIKSSEMESGKLAENGHSSDAAGEHRSSLILLGTGCSSVVPNAMCLIQPSDPPCNVCFQSLSLPPERNPNYRCNTSLLIDYCQSNGEHKYILIDAGKTFREQVIRWFTFYKIPQVDSIILTHEHADAVLGLDDMRAVQPFSPTNDISPTPVYLSQYAMESIAVKFPYLIKKKLKEGQELRRVAQLDWKIIESHHEKPFVASGLQFVPLPVMHGEDYLCLGFLFGEKCKVAYISDVSRFPPSTEYVISKNGGGQLDLLILDTLYKNGSHNTHFCFPQTLEAVKRICPKRALLVGMTHDFDHHKDNETLMEWSRREGIPVQLAHDGLRVPIDL